MDGQEADQNPFGKRAAYICTELTDCPPNEEALVANEGWNQDRWEFLRLKDGINAEWTGDFASADEAMAAVRKLARYVRDGGEERAN